MTSFPLSIFAFNVSFHDFHFPALPALTKGLKQINGLEQIKSLKQINVWYWSADGITHEHVGFFRRLVFNAT